MKTWTTTWIDDMDDDMEGDMDDDMEGDMDDDMDDDMEGDMDDDMEGDMDDDMMGDDMMMMKKHGFLFTSGSPDYGHGLESLAEDGDPSALAAYHGIGMDDMMMDSMMMHDMMMEMDDMMMDDM